MPSKKIEYNCTNCQGSFIRGKSDIEKTLKKNNTVFCSIKCSKNYNKESLEAKEYLEKWNGKSDEGRKRKTSKL